MFAYPSALLVGVPLYFVLPRRGLLRLWQLILAGGVVGTTPALYFFAGIFSPLGRQLIALVATIGFVAGILSGATFWLVLNMRSRHHGVA
jgi:hypothetical protein